MVKAACFDQPHRWLQEMHYMEQIKQWTPKNSEVDRLPAAHDSKPRRLSDWSAYNYSTDIGMVNISIIIFSMYQRKTELICN